MTRRTNARVAGFAFLIYIAVGLTGIVLENRAAAGEGTAAKLASIARHATEMRMVVVLGIVCCFCALVLAVTLRSITRDQDPDLAMLVLVCRAGEGVIGAVSLSRPLGQLWLATAAGADAPDPAAANALGAVLLKLPSGSSTLAATFFAVGSLAFSWLLLRGRIVPAPLAWVGLFASVLIVVGLPLRLVDVLGSPITDLMWLPMLVFEVPLGFWLILKGAGMPARGQPA